MKNIQTITTILFFFLSSFILLHAQVSINTDNSPPDPSAMLDVKSTDKGILVPRMNSNSRENITTPANGLLVYDLTTSSYWYYGNMMWNEIRSSSKTLELEDLIDSPAPLFSCMDTKASFGVGSHPRSIAVDENYAYIVDSDHMNLRVIDISDLTNLNVVGTKGGFDPPTAIQVLGDYAYIAEAGLNELVIIDISDRSNPSNAGSFLVDGNPGYIAVEGSHAYIIDNVTDKFLAIDVSDANNPTLAKELHLGETPKYLAVSGNYAYTTNVGFLEIIDITVPSNATLLGGNLSIGEGITDITASGNQVYITDNQNNRLRIVDVSNPNNPAIIGTLTFASVPKAIALSGDNVFIIDAQSDELKVVDVSNPSQPTLIGSTAVGANPIAIAAFNNIAYVVDNNSEDLKVISSCNVLLGIDGNTGAFTQVYQNEVDNQTIDVLTLNGSILEMSLENDGEANQSVDLSGINTIQNSIADDDNNTKIQVEESANEDVIRFDIGGVEQFVMNPNQFSIFSDNVANLPTILFNSFVNVGNSNTISNVFHAGAEPASAYQMNFSVNGNTTLSLQGDGGVVINETYTLPLTDGTENQVLKTDGSGNLDWTSISTPSSFSTIQDNDNNTKIQVEESANENFIRMDVANHQLMVLSPDRTVSIIGGTRDLLTLEADDNANEGGIAFRNTGSSHVWSIHRVPSLGNSDLADLVISGGNAPANPANLTERLRIDTDGNVGIGTNSPSYKLQVGTNGDGTEARANAWNTFSDRRWKTDLEIIENALEKIEQINGYYYKWKDRPDTSTQVGLMAQEIEMILPEIVSTDAEGYKSVDYSKLTALLIQAIKEQQEIIEGHSLQIDGLVEEMKKIKKNLKN